MGEFPILADDESDINGQKIFDADVRPYMETFPYESSFRDVVKTLSVKLDDSSLEVSPFQRKVSTLNALNYFIANISHFTGRAECVLDTYIRKVNEFYECKNISKNEYNHYISFVRV